MQININGNHVDISPELQAYTDKKLSKLVNHHDIISHIQITYSQEGLKNISQGQVSVPGKQLIAKGEGKTMSAAMDALIDKLVQLVLKHKSRSGEHR